MRGDCGTTLKGANGLGAMGWEECCGLVGWGSFGGDFGESTITSGGDRGAESEVLDNGR